MKNQKLNIAIVGYGFVGKAVEYGFKNENTNIILIDPILGTDLSELDGKSIGVTFVCVPTPFGDDGKIDSSIVESVLGQLIHNQQSGIIVLKSTVTPDIVGRFANGCSRFVYNPEFLTERNANEDFVNPKLHIFGGPKQLCLELHQIYSEYSNCKYCPAHYVSAAEASFIKYGINNFLAMKVSFFNQFHQLIERNGCNYDNVAAGMKLDPRIGTSHMQVPGPDGRFGFGGACFTKDSNALLKFSNNSMSIIKEVIEYNNEIRSVYELDKREKDQKVRYAA